MKKQIIYIMPYNTEAEIKKVNEKRQRLYNKYNSVQVYPNGLSEVRIICEN